MNTIIRMAAVLIASVLGFSSTMLAEEKNQTEKVWRYDFFADAEHHIPTGFHRAKSGTIGQMFLSNDRKRFVYLSFKRPVAGCKPVDANVQYEYVAGFDGKAYWFAGFWKTVFPRPPLKNSGPKTVWTKKATQVRQFENKKAVNEFLEGRLGRGPYWNWFAYVPFHGMMQSIECHEFDHDALVDAIKRWGMGKTIFENGKWLINPKKLKLKWRVNREIMITEEFIQPKRHTKYITLKIDNWRYTLELQPEEPFISKCQFNCWPCFSGGNVDVAYPSVFGGGPRQFTMTLQSKQATVDSRIFSARFHSSKETVFDTITAQADRKKKDLYSVLSTQN